MPLLCQECLQKPFCSDPCPEVLLFSNQDNISRREHFHFSEPQYKKPIEEISDAPRFTKTESKILTLAKKNLSREEVLKILGISRENLLAYSGDRGSSVTV